MFSCETCEIFQNTCFEEYLPTNISINERQQETHVFSGKKNESILVKLSRVQSVLLENYFFLNSTQLRN